MAPRSGGGDGQVVWDSEAEGHWRWLHTRSRIQDVLCLWTTAHPCCPRTSPSAHKGLAKVAFTGSAATGRLVAQAAAANIRPASMELGGKSALIVFEDADIEKAVEWAMVGPGV